MANVPRDPLADAVGRYRQAVDDIETAKAAAAQQVEAARQKAAGAREALAEAIVTAARSGRRQRDLVALTGYSRERVRQILRAAGVEAD